MKSVIITGTSKDIGFTQMARGVRKGGDSIYPQINRFGGLFEASLKTPTPASVVADKILEIAESGTWILRYPVGPDAIPFLGWRVSKTDEEWVDWNAANDEDWYNAVANEFGLNARLDKSPLEIRERDDVIRN
jgi:hypothetical protein